MKPAAVSTDVSERRAKVERSFMLAGDQDGVKMGSVVLSGSLSFGGKESESVL